MTFTAVDAGNTGTAQTVVTVSLDITPPELTVPAPIALEVDMPSDVVALVMMQSLPSWRVQPRLITRMEMSHQAS